MSIQKLNWEFVLTFTLDMKLYLTKKIIIDLMTSCIYNSRYIKKRSYYNMKNKANDFRYCKRS